MCLGFLLSVTIYTQTKPQQNTIEIGLSRESFLKITFSVPIPGLQFLFQPNTLCVHVGKGREASFLQIDIGAVLHIYRESSVTRNATK